MSVTTITTWILNHKKIVYNAFTGVLMALLLAFGISTHKKNKQLSEELLNA